MARALVTGASGFIGYHLIKHLLDRGDEVTCFVRPASDVDVLERLDLRFAHGDVTDKLSVHRAIRNSDVVFHLAGLTKTLRAQDLRRINETGVRNVAEVCAGMETPPVLIVVSSLAAAGPASPNRARTEADPPAPVSAYGRSKRAGELAAIEFADRVPTTIVRPPIVLGERDRDVFLLFKSIARWGVHLVPTLRDFQFSIIHAADLAAAMDLLARRGRRLDRSAGTAGTYYAAVDETPTYAKLGQMIGSAVGRRRVRIIRNFPVNVWAIALMSETYARLRRRPHILSLDKAREAIAGSWACSSAAIARDVGFAPAKSLPERLQQTAQWYAEQGLLRLHESRAPNFDKQYDGQRELSPCTREGD